MSRSPAGGPVHAGSALCASHTHRFSPALSLPPGARSAATAAPVASPAKPHPLALQVCPASLQTPRFARIACSLACLHACLFASAQQPSLSRCVHPLVPRPGQPSRPPSPTPPPVPPSGRPPALTSKCTGLQHRSVLQLGGTAARRGRGAGVGALGLGRPGAGHAALHLTFGGAPSVGHAVVRPLGAS